MKILVNDKEDTSKEIVITREGTNKFKFEYFHDEVEVPDLIINREEFKLFVEGVKALLKDGVKD